MNIGVLGSGDVGQTLARGFADRKHDVMIGTRSPDKLEDWAKKTGVKVGTPEEVAKHGEMIVVATLGTGTEEALTLAGPTHFDGKVVIDATNPLDFSKGMPPGILYVPNDSLGERIQKMLPRAHVVKAFNTVPNAQMVDPKFQGGAPEMLICGNDAAAKKKVEAVLRELGWPGVIDLGGIENARWLEAMVGAWVRVALALGSFNIALKVVRGSE